MASYENQSNGAGIPPKITLYTHHACPYAHRAHIALKELDLPYEEVIIDLDKPREPWYLEINPRGLVPSIKYSNGILDSEIITESSVVAQFLADARPSHLLPASNASPTAALTRARAAWFIDTWNTKLGDYLMRALKAETLDEKEELAGQWFEAVKKEIEPHLAGVNPFFGGSERMTIVEVNIAPFLIRLYAYSNDQFYPKSLPLKLETLPNFHRWAQATIQQESVTYIWDEEKILARTARRLEKMKAQK